MVIFKCQKCNTIFEKKSTYVNHTEKRKSDCSPPILNVEEDELKVQNIIPDEDKNIPVVQENGPNEHETLENENMDNEYIHTNSENVNAKVTKYKCFD
jgi:hypothetical protein